MGIMSERGKRADYTEKLNKDLLLMLGGQPLPEKPEQKKEENMFSNLNILSEKDDLPEEADLPELDELPKEEDLPELDELPEEETLSELDELSEEDLPEKEDSFEIEGFPEFKYLTQTPAVTARKKKKNGKNNDRKHASPWKEAAANPNAAPRKEKKTAGSTSTLKKRQPEKTKVKKHKDTGDRRFIIMTICIVLGVLAAAGALIYVSLLFLY